MLKKLPHTYVIIFFIIILSAILTWIVPGGQYKKEVKNINNSKREIIIDGSFQKTNHNVQSWQIFGALFKGFVNKSDIIIFIFMVGGAFMIIGKSKAIDMAIFAFLLFTKKIKNKKFFSKIGVDNWVLIAIMLIFSMFGAIFGMSEETIPFTMIIVPLAISMGYDSIVGVSIVFVAAGLGFAGAILNPFTIGVAQGIAGIQIFSGIQYRLFSWFVINIIGITYIVIYARKVKASPERSIVYKDDAYWRNKKTEKFSKFNYKKPLSAWIMYLIILSVLVFSSLKYYVTTFMIGSESLIIPAIPIITVFFAITGFTTLRKSVHFFILILLVITILFLVVGVMAYGWYILKIASIFFALGIVSGVSMNYNPNKIVDLFLEGVKDIASAALVVGLAGGIIEILQDGKIIDTILFSISSLITDMGKIASISMMYFFQIILNLFIPSGSGQAALTMPIMTPLSDILGISRQAAVMAFQFGDGFTNLITPTSGVLIAVLGVAKIPYEKWFIWALPFIILMTIVALLLLIPTVTINLSGF